MIQFDNLSIFINHITIVEECEENVSTVIHVISGDQRVVQVPYKEVLKRLYKLRTGATVW